MDIEEAAWRFRANLVVVVAGVLVGLVVAGAFGLSRNASYRASSRLVVDMKDPKDVHDSRVIADTGQAIVGSEGRVKAALKAAHAKRDPELFARDNVSVTAVGSSPVLELSVVDHSPVVAAAVSNWLAADLIRTRKDLAELRFAGVLSELDQRIAVASAGVDRSAQALRSAAGQRGLSPAAEQYREAVKHLDDLEADRRRVFENKASVPEPSLIERAAVPTDAEQSGRVPDLVLGAILGLVLGVGVAAIRETLRPSVAGDRAITRLLDVPSVGTLSGPPDVVDDASLKAVGARLRLAAEAAGVRKLALTSAGPTVDLDGFAERLSGVIDGKERGSKSLSEDKRISWEVFSTEGDGLRALRGSPSTVGLVLVAPTVLKRQDLDGVMDLRLMTGWQLFGCMTYPRPRWPRRRRTRTLPGSADIKRPSEDAPSEAVGDLRDPDRSGSISLGEREPTPIVLDTMPPPAAVESASMSSEAFSSSATDSPPSDGKSRLPAEVVASSGDETAEERVAGPEGSLHWSPWGRK